ncbi:dynein axonemal assembly factor 5 [Episyrphus balteatus]|uniref:dynein axonemal assembly factor 5 n=1 Tax=Episyrphus balteatus TaxID=286459 RepID=UPI00248554C0|nr:dynein axonemal assembly factor 5 [Episyrphus balteatus]
MSEIREKIWEDLQSTDRRVRLTALKDLESICNTVVDLRKIISVFDECYLHLLNCYADQYESCREQSTITVATFMKNLPVNDFYLQNVIVSMAARMGRAETIEESEEIRFLHLNQLSAIIDKYKKTDSNDYLSQSYDDIMDILYKALSDPFPAVQKEACGCIVKLSKATSVFHQRAESLTKPLFTMLNHKHSQNRIAAIEACYAIALHINSNSETLVRIFCETSPLLMDLMPLVRRECGRMGCLMLTELKDRYSFFDRIIPLVLCCLKDDSPEVREDITVRWKECGQLYYDENETELKKLEIGERLPSNYPEWEVRPTIGCRALVQRSLRLVHTIMRESGDWKEHVRVHALRLMYQFVLHAEAAMTAKFFEIYPDLAKACADPESSVAPEAMKVADLMGRLLSYADWKEHAIEGLEKNPKLGYIRCFFHLFAAATDANEEDILTVSNILVRKEFSQSLNPEIQLYILGLVDELWRKHTIRTTEDAMSSLNLNPDSTIERSLYTVTIRIMALSYGTDSIVAKYLNRKQEILEKIALYINTDVSALHAKHLAWVLEQMDDLDAMLDSRTEPIILLCGLIHICGYRPAALEVLKRNIRLVWDNAADDAKIKVFTAMSISMLKWKETMNGECEEELEKLVKELIEERIEWKAGAGAESMRSLATATLCAMTHGAPTAANKILPKMSRYFTNLLEDNSISTRNYALKCLLNFGQLEVEQLRPIAFGVLQRLDDPHSGSRELAAKVIPKLKPICPTQHDQNLWNAFIKKACSSLFLYFDGPELKLREAIKETLIELGKLYPAVFEEPMNVALATSFQKEEVQKIKEAVYEQINIED